MTKLLRPLSITSILICGFSLSACSSVPQDGVVATDMTGSFSQMWSNVFTGQLRPAPQAEYSFGGSDATLNTSLLMNRAAYQAVPARQYRPNYISNPPQAQASYARPASQQLFQHSMTRSVQRPVPTPSYGHVATSELSPENPWSRRQSVSPSLDSYESYRPQKSAALQPAEDLAPPRPARSQPVISEPYVERDAYPAELPTQQTANYTPAAEQDWESANQEIGEDLSYVKIGGGSKISDWQSCEGQAGSYFLTTATGFLVAPEFDSCMRSKGYKPEAEAELELAQQ